MIAAGENGNHEAVVPMGAGGGGGGGGITFNISGTFLEADPNTWQRMIREKIVPEIGRYTMINPTGNFNRRRGLA
jgi:hypothetical protein